MNVSINELLQGPEHETNASLEIRVGSIDKPLYGMDRMLVDHDNGLYGIFDGVGSADDAGIAAEGAANGFAANDTLRNLREVASVDQALQYMRNAFETTQGAVSSETHFGSTTAAVAKVITINDEPFLVAGNAGDSRIMLQRGGVVSDITKEQCDPETPNVIYNCLGLGERSMLHEFKAVPLREGDKVILCSDGITGDREKERLTDAEFARSLDTNDPSEAAQRSLDVSKKSDDKSAIVLIIDKIHDEGEKQQTTASHVDTEPVQRSSEESNEGFTDEQAYRIASLILEHNGISWEDADGLRGDRVLKIPAELYKQLLK